MTEKFLATRRSPTRPVMGELSPEAVTLIPSTNGQRLDAALTIAEMRPEELHHIAYYLCQLGLAAHSEDGRFHSIAEKPEQPTWFSPRHDRHLLTFRVPQGALDDCR